MEKSIEVIARYHYKKDYFVEVTQEKSAIADRDYWLCRKNTPKKLYMFSSPVKNDSYEERMIIKHIRECVHQYESPTMVTA